MLEERDTDLNEEEDIGMEDSKEEHFMDVSKYGNDKKNIHDLRWDVYIKREELIKRVFLLSIPHPKGGDIVWTCLKRHIIKEKELHKAIGLVVLIINYLKKRRLGGYVNLVAPRVRTVTRLADRSN